MSCGRLTNGPVCDKCGKAPCGCAGDGWRMLAVGEIVCAGDEWRNGDEWFPVTATIGLMHLPQWQIRRRITPPANGVTTLKDSGQPLFEQRANATIERVRQTFGQRGSEYGDTWRNCRFVVMKAIARDLKLSIPDDCYRALATAAFIDMKYQRSEGGYKEDSLIDGIAYQAFLADEMRELKGGGK